MPRPKNGYRLKDGTKVPGVTDITGRYKDTKALIMWANKEGLAGRKLYASRDRVIETGTIIHGAAELSLRGEPYNDVTEYIKRELPDQAMRDNAMRGFEAFEEFRTRINLKAYKQEISLVSENHRYGGTIDIMATVDNQLAIVDLKSAKDKTTVAYPDQFEQLAAYKGLWDESHPQEKVTGGFYLILLPKDGSPFKPYYHEHLRKFWTAFLRHREMYELDRELTDPKMIAGVPLEYRSRREFRRAEMPKIEAPRPVYSAWLERCRRPAA